VPDHRGASMGTSCILRNMMALHLEREWNSNAVSVGNTAVSNGIRKPPLCTISRFLSVCFTRLSAFWRRATLCFFNLRFKQEVKGTFPFNTFKQHSPKLFISSLLQAPSIAFLNLGAAVLRTLRA
jgi:hypothetical protein